MILRQATSDDAAEICAITNAVIRDTLFTFTTTERTPAGIAADIKERDARFQVAERDGRLLGFATYAPFRGGPGYAYSQEHTIQLAAGARGRGVGRALMARLEQVARQDQVHVLIAGISGANPAAIAFHTAIGFDEVGRLPETGFKAGQWLDLVLMQKTLVAGTD